MSSLSCDREQLSEFVRTVFANVDGKGLIALRAFHDDKASKAALFRTYVKSNDLGDVIDQAAKVIDKCGGEPNSVVFCPPVCTFAPGTTRAREIDIHEGVAVSVELDIGPSDALKALRSIIGTPSLVVQSGGFWLNEVFDEMEPKLHVYWVLKKPATGDDVVRLKHARRLATSLAGGDRSNVPAVHPIRWPGSWHRKNIAKPVLTRIIENSGTQWELEDVVARLEKAADARGVAVPNTAAGARVDERETKDLVLNVVSGAELHDSLVPLAMRMMTRGVPQDMTTAFLQGLMEASSAPRDDRWQARYADLGRTISSAYAQAEMRNTPGWKQLLNTTRAGAIANDYENILRAFRKSPQFEGSLRFNRRTKLIEMHKAPPWRPDMSGIGLWEDADATLGAAWLAAEGFPKIKPTEIHAVVEAVAQGQSYDPLLEYLGALQWDGVARLDSWLGRYCGVDVRAPEREAYARTVGRCWMIGAVARAFLPGCKMDTVMILEGAQGIRKSTALAVLGGKWFAEFTVDLSHGGKDALLSLASPWIVELAELNALRRAEAKQIKSFLSATSDRYRTPYGRVVKDVPRGLVFAGSINPDGGEYLLDTTGNRRFWPVTVPGVIDTDALARDRDQLWAEAVARFKRGDAWHITERDVAQIAEREQEARSVSVLDDPWLDRIKSYVEASRDISFKLSEVIEGALLMPARDISMAQAHRAGKILISLGYVKKHTRTGKVWVWDL